MPLETNDVSWGHSVWDRANLCKLAQKEQVASIPSAFSSKLLAEHASLLCCGAVRLR